MEAVFKYVTERYKDVLTSRQILLQYCEILLQVDLNKGKYVHLFMNANTPNTSIPIIQNTLLLPIAIQANGLPEKFMQLAAAMHEDVASLYQ